MSIYKIKNVATNKYLHVNIPNGTAVSSGESVVLCSESDTNEQWWDVSTLSNNAVIRFVINYRYSPNISCDCDCDCGNKCELQVISGNESNSFMNIIKTGSYYKIQHRSTSYYLTADGTYNGADTYWDTANGSNAQLWQFTEITPYEAISGEDYTYPNESRKIREEYSADHSGIDIVANEGDEVYAFANGVISYKQDVDNGDSKGICIAINHHNPDITIESGLYATSIYMHLSSIRNLEIGTFVEKGQLIGYVGKTGDADVPHLHFALAVGSNNTMRPGVTGVSLASLNLIDPEKYLTEYVNIKFRWPTDSRTISCGFKDPRYLDHDGIDIILITVNAQEKLEPIYAIADGTIERFFPWIGLEEDNDYWSYGVCLFIKHSPEQTETDYYMRSMYMHMDRVTVTSGNVTKGQIIGYMGNTGYYISSSPDGTHLHLSIKCSEFEFQHGTYYSEGEFVDPMNYKYYFE
ncbi:MAG: peptidoglycan DD-metalloendopeptidase family protein [Clostridia bacterium]|nr:peptidoglycan DD-metalloendopeptidase family protein [Clostridia bacterium]